MTLIKALCLLSIITFLFTACIQQSAEDLVEEWVTEHAIEISTVEAGNGFDDLLPIGKIVDGARIVSLGEPTHGNREVFLLKNRLVEYLVTEKGFNIFALECPFGEAYDVNKYILEGIGTPEEALAGIYFWTWDTKEFVELLEWMRAYNADTTHTKKVKFQGFDIQDPERSARVMLEYIKKVDQELWQSVKGELEILEIQFSDPTTLGRRPYIPEEYDEASLSAIKSVMEAFQVNKEVYISKSSQEDWVNALHHSRQVELWIEACYNEGENYVEIRDQGQAENIKWILDQEGDGSKAIVWAHNCHVSNAAPKDDVNMHGYYLRKMYRDELKIFGLFYNRGGFKAIDANSPSNGIINFYVDQSPPGTLEHTLAKAQHSLAIFNMEELPNDGPVRDWFYTKRPTRHSGGGYNEKKPENYFWSYAPAEAFDVLVYIDSTNPVLSVNEDAYKYLWKLDKKLNTPTNLNFERDSNGQEPSDWMVWSKFQRLGVEFEVTDENAYEGKNSVKLHRPTGDTFGEITPSLLQSIDATPYQGKKIRVTVACRAKVNDPGFAFFRLVIEPDVLQSAHDGSPPLFDSLDKFRISSADWDILQIEAEVPQIANTLTYGIYLRDPGTVWMDDLNIEVIE